MISARHGMDGTRAVLLCRLVSFQCGSLSSLEQGQSCPLAPIYLNPLHWQCKEMPQSKSVANPRDFTPPLVSCVIECLLVKTSFVAVSAIIATPFWVRSLVARAAANWLARSLTLKLPKCEVWVKQNSKNRRKLPAKSFAAAKLGISSGALVWLHYFISIWFCIHWSV